jgi:hypothetical protein
MKVCVVAWIDVVSRLLRPSIYLLIYQSAARLEYLVRRFVTSKSV